MTGLPSLSAARIMVSGNGGAADEFDDDMDLGIIDDLLPIGRHQRIAGLRRGAVRRTL